MTPQEVIKEVNHLLRKTNKKGTAALNEVIQTVSNGKFKSLDDLRNIMLSEIRKAPSANDFLKNSCDILLGNADTGAITGSDAGNATVKTAANLVPITNKISDWVLPNPGSSTTYNNGLTVNWPTAGADGKTFTEAEKFILRGMNSSWIESCLSLAEESLNLSFRDNDVYVKTIDVHLIPKQENDKNWLAWVVNTPSNDYDHTVKLDLYVNMKNYAGIDITSEIGTSSGSPSSLSRVLAHELVHALTGANYHYYAYMPSYIAEGMADIILGIDDNHTSTLEYFAGSGVDKLEGNLIGTVTSNDIYYDPYAAGYILLRYLAKQSATTYTKNFVGTEDADTFETRNDGVTISSAGGNDTIRNGSYEKNAIYDGGNSVSIDAGNGNDYIYNKSGNNVTISAGNGNDQAHSYEGDSVHVSLGAGNDYFNAFHSKNVTVYGGDDKDTIYANGGEKLYYDGGAGKDFFWIYNSTNLATIIGGKDDDTISLSSDTTNTLIQYKAGDGNDLIKNISATATVSIEGEYTSTVIGNDRMLIVGKDTITVSNGANVNFTILNKVPQPNLIVGTEDDNIINNTLDGATIQALGGNDSINNGNYVNNVLIVGGSGNDTIRNKGFNVTIDGCENDDYIWNDTSKVSIVGGSGNDKIYSYGANVTIDAGAGNDTIGNNSVYATNSTIQGGAGNDSIKNVAAKVSINAGNGDDTIINSNVNSNVNSGDSVTIDGGLGNDSISNSAANVLFVYSGGNDTITGFNSTSTLKIGDGFATYSKETVSGNVIVTVGKEKITLEGATKLSAINIMGEEKKVTVDSTRVTLTNASASKITLSSNVKYADASSRTKAVKITGNKFANTISGGSKNDTLDGGAGNDSLSGGKGNDSLVGSKGNDTLDGGKGNDTLTGGAGKDLFIYSAGNDVITDYAAGDKISLGAAISSTSIKGSDALFTIGKNTLTVAKGKDKELTIINAAGKTQTIIGGALLVDNSTNKKTTLESWRTTADASARTSAIQLTGNKFANTILGGTKNDTLYGGSGNDFLVGNAGNDKLYGQKGNDTLVGGAGNDSLWGDKGADVFLFESGDGKDIIFGFDNSDMLQITGAFSASYNKSKGEVYFKVGSTKNAITLKDFTATKFNVNGYNYHISGKKLVK